MTLNLEDHVRLAKSGSKKSLETVIECIHEKIYGLSLRMLGNAEDAEDESQEILIKVITHLSGFREKSAFSSWVYRVACNHLLNTQKQKNYRERVTFGFLEEQIYADAHETYPLAVSGPEQDFLAEEARLNCMQIVLACLDQKIRMTYILGDMFDVTSEEGAYIFDITSGTFRKRLSRGRKHIREFMIRHCGMVNEKNRCRCHKQAGKQLALNSGIKPVNSMVKREGAEQNRAEAVAHLQELSEIKRISAMFRNYPEYQSPDSFTHILKDLIQSGNYTMFMK